MPKVAPYAAVTRVEGVDPEPLPEPEGAVVAAEVVPDIWDGYLLPRSSQR